MVLKQTLVLVSTIMKNPEINMDTIADGGQLTTAAFSQIPVLGPIILVVGIITFAWSTILGWSYYGERCAQYLWGKKALLPYKLLFVAVVVVGPVLALDLVWTIADILNALMAIPNLIAVLLLSGVTARETNYYLNHLEETDPGRRFPGGPLTTDGGPRSPLGERGPFGRKFSSEALQRA